MAAILIVDDDPHIRELVSIQLRQEGFQIFEAEDGVCALQALNLNRIDLAILDVMMPKMDGFDLCREIRESSDIPLLMLTAKGETPHKVKGFQLGADDYLVKPFETAELVARVKALLKRYRIASSQMVEFGGLQMNRQTYEVYVNHTSVSMPRKEFELLFTLASHPGTTCSRESLIETVWGYDYDGDERTVDVHIKRLRDRFPEDQSSFRIRTVWGLGYRLEASQP